MIDSLIDSLKNQLAVLELEHSLPGGDHVYLTLEAPINENITLLPSAIDHSFLISKPNSRFSMLGLGAFLTFQSTGRNRIEHIKSNYLKVINKWYTDHHSLPTAFMAFAFDDNDPMTDNWHAFANTCLTIPKVLIKQQDSSQTLCVNINIDQTAEEDTFKPVKALLSQYLQELQPSSKNVTQSGDCRVPAISDKKSWLNLSQKALTQIRSGLFDKLVTSRRCSLEIKGVLPITDLFQKLNAHYPSCTILSYRLSGSNIIAASPERLFTLQHPDIHSDAIGGTILRQEKSALPLQLLQPQMTSQNTTTQDQKLLKEHAFIAEDIYQRLAPICSTLKMPMSPFLMKLHNMFHLESTISGKLDNSCDIFDVIKTLHPTPAVAGFPALAAKQWLLHNENYHRGWYTGSFGWIEGHHNGELSVMLRCALIKDRQVDLFAGAGLVAESDPDTEWRETELKMQTILEML